LVGVNADNQSVNVRYEERYMTLSSIIDLVPPEYRDTSVIYRVKPPDEFDRFGRCVYTYRRFVAIRPDGQSICTCLLGRHLGIPCAHFFAVLRQFPQNEFNISMVHPHWQLPDQRIRAQTRPFVHLRHTNAPDAANRQQTRMNPQPPAAIGAGSAIGAVTPAHSGIPPRANRTVTPPPRGHAVGTTLSTDPAAHFQELFMTPRQTHHGPDAKRKNYTRVIELTKHLMKLIGDDDTLADRMLLRLHSDIEHVQEQQSIASYDVNIAPVSQPRPIVDGSTPEVPLPLDPVRVNTPGRKRTSRLKSSVELSSPKKRRKM
jgi:hypothetical protein